MVKSGTATGQQKHPGSYPRKRPVGPLRRQQVPRRRRQCGQRCDFNFGKLQNVDSAVILTLASSRISATRILFPYFSDLI